MLRDPEAIVRNMRALSKRGASLSPLKVRGHRQ